MPSKLQFYSLMADQAAMLTEGSETFCFHGPAERQRARYGRAEGKRRDVNRLSACFFLVNSQDLCRFSKLDLLYLIQTRFLEMQTERQIGVCGGKEYEKNYSYDALPFDDIVISRLR